SGFPSFRIVFGSAFMNVSKRHESRMTMTKLFSAFGSGRGPSAPAPVIGRWAGRGAFLGASFFLKRCRGPIGDQSTLALAPVVLREHLCGRRAHHALVGHLALVEQLAHPRARDRHLRPALVVLDEADSADLLEVRGEAHVDGLDRELASELPEDLL